MRLLVGASAAGRGTAWRFLSFSQVGLAVMALGYVMLWTMVGVLHVSHIPAFVLQAVISIEVNFLLNHRFTWRDRPGSRLTRLVKFNLSRGVLAVASIGAFAALSSAGIEYLVANTLCTGAAIVVNFVTSDRWVFTATAMHSGSRLELPGDRWPLPPATSLERHRHS